MAQEKRNDNATITAAACQVTAAYVRMVVSGKRSTNSKKAASVLAHYNEVLKAKNNLSQPAENAA